MGEGVKIESPLDGVNSVLRGWRRLGTCDVPAFSHAYDWQELLLASVLISGSLGRVDEPEMPHYMTVYSAAMQKIHQEMDRQYELGVMDGKEMAND